MKAMILAAGFGTRLRPLTFAVPKPMVRICNRPLIGYAVEGFIRAGIEEIVVNLHHLPEAIEDYLTQTYGRRVKFHFSREEEILGTGGGVRKVRPVLAEGEEFFLVNGDTVQFPPYERLRQARRELNALAALTLRHPPVGDRFTAVWYEQGRVTGFGRGSGEPLMFSGAHLISSRIYSLLPEKDFSGIVDEVYQPVIAAGSDTVAGVVDDGPWFDIGTPQRYLSAAGEILKMTLEGAIPLVEGSKIHGENVLDESSNVQGRLTQSSVGARSFVKGELRNSIVGADCRLIGSVRLDSCILGDGVEITRPVEFRRAMICRMDDSMPRDPSYHYEDGLVIADI